MASAIEIDLEQHNLTKLDSTPPFRSQTERTRSFAPVTLVLQPVPHGFGQF